MNIESKVIVVGDSGVGKTSFIRRLVDGVFINNSRPTLDAAVKTYQISRHRYVFWDTAGQERFRSIIPLYYKGSHCVLVFYDMSNKDRDDNLVKWLCTIDSYVRKNVPVVIVGTKSDKIGAKEVDYDNEYMQKLLSKYNVVGRVITSSKEESQNEFLEKFKNIFELTYEYAKDHPGPRRHVVKIDQSGYIYTVRKNLDYYSWGYCNIL